MSVVKKFVYSDKIIHYTRKTIFAYSCVLQKLNTLICLPMGEASIVDSTVAAAANAACITETCQDHMAQKEVHSKWCNIVNGRNIL